MESFTHISLKIGLHPGALFKRFMTEAVAGSEPNQVDIINVDDINL